MSGLIPFNNKNSNLVPRNAGFDDFYNMLDDFFTGSSLPTRSLVRDTFKIDVSETDKEYLVEAELPGLKKENINLNVDNECLCISVEQSEEINEDKKNYIHRERRVSSMSRRIQLTGAKLDDIKAKFKDGVLTITILKDKKVENSRKINIE